MNTLFTVFMGIGTVYAIGSFYLNILATHAIANKLGNKSAILFYLDP